MPCPSSRARPKKSDPIVALTPPTRGATLRPLVLDDRPTSIVRISCAGANAYSCCAVSCTTVATAGVADHSTVGYTAGSSVVMEVAGDAKSMRTPSISVPLANVTVNAKPDGYVRPEPSKSPTPTTVPPAPMVALSPCSATTLSTMPPAKATSTVFHCRADGRAMSCDVPRYA